MSTDMGLKIICLSQGQTEPNITERLFMKQSHTGFIHSISLLSTALTVCVEGHGKGWNQFPLT